MDRSIVSAFRPHWLLVALETLDAAAELFDEPEGRDSTGAFIGSLLLLTPSRALVIADFPTYMVVYRVTETEVRITRIWHGRQSRGRN